MNTSSRVMFGTLILFCLAGCQSNPQRTTENVSSNHAECISDHENISINRRDSLACRSSGCKDANSLLSLATQYVDSELPAIRHQELLNLISHRPKICLALSGGGQRSAAFSIGVMRGLEAEKPGIMSKVAYASAVSGGGYALGWLAKYGMVEGVSVEKLFPENSSYQSFLADQSSNGASSFVAISASLVAFGGLGPKWQWKNPGGGGAELSIPRRGALDYASALGHQFLRGSTYTFGYKAPTLAEVRDAYPRTTLPYPIWNATALPSRYESVTVNSSGEYGANAISQLRTNTVCPSFRESIMEIHPNGVGNSVYGYKDLSELKDSVNGPLRVLEAMVISGAAFEKPHEGKHVLGGLLKNFSDGQDALIINKPSQPSPEFFWLTDGGRAENLGVNALLLRGCETIIAVDGEHDPNGVFEAYVRLRENLKEAYNLHLKVEDIETHIEDTDKTCNLRAASRWDYDSKSSNNCFRAAAFKQPSVFHGNISVGGINSAENPSFANLIYVKLGLSESFLTNGNFDKDLEDSWKSISASYEREKKKFEEEFSRASCAGEGLSLRCRFPQEATANQALREGVWNAYVNLGSASLRSGFRREEKIREWLK